MKITLIADVHGNLPALEAVLQHARAQGATGMIFNLGDLTGYGPFPEEVVRWSCSPQVISVLGDYDQKVLSKEHRMAQWESVTTPDKRTMFAWTYNALSKQSRKHLLSLPARQTITVEGVKVLLKHTSPDGQQEWIGQETPDEQLAELAAMEDAAVVVSGHTHQAFAQAVNGVLFVNPGTVGRPDDGDPRASYAILKIDNGHVAVEHHRVAYHIMATVDALRQAGLPEIFSQVVRRGLNYQDTVAVVGNPPASEDLEPCGTVALLTDFGLKDHFVGVMKGVIARIAPQATLVDISHQVRPQSVIEGARLLAQSAPYFAPGTVHIAVVDPGVGTNRRALAAQIGEHFFVVPDNGLLTLLLEKAWAEGQTVRLISLTKPEYWLPQISAIFHGRDIFAPVGAHLVNGIPLESMGEAIDDPQLVRLAHPQPTGTGWQAQVELLDGFGNICTNLLGSWLPDDKENLAVRIGDTVIHGLNRTFGDASPGTLIALVDSTGHLAIAEVNGNAAERLKIHPGTPVFVDVIVE